MTEGRDRLFHDSACGEDRLPAAGHPDPVLAESDSVPNDVRALLRAMQAQLAECLTLLRQPGPDQQAGVARETSTTLRRDSEGARQRASRPAMPDPRLIRRIIQQRQLRLRHFDGSLFADPAWDMLLDLTAARAEHVRVSVTSLCIASGVPPTTALRWIGQMVEAGLLCRVEDDCDRRRAFITLTDTAADAMARYFADLGRNAIRAI